MHKFKKHLTSIIVFVINLVLMGVGFLFIKKSDEAKKNNWADENALTESKIGEENIVETPADETPVNVSQEEVLPDTKNILSNTAPTNTGSKIDNNKNNASSAKTNISTNTKKSSSSSKKSSATTKTS